MITTCESVQSAVRHFLDLSHLETGVLRRILNTGHLYRRRERRAARPLLGRILALVFEKPSTRTRVSFEVGMRQLGGEVIVLKHRDTQLSRGETIADTAKVLSRYVDAVMLRTSTSDNLHEMARHASVPIINGLTQDSHPCQVMADLLTFEQHRGSLAGRVVAWCGDGNNVAVSWIQAAPHFGFRLRLACPESLMPEERSVTWARTKGGDVTLMTDPREAVWNADCVVTDTWTSMGIEDRRRPELLRSYQVNAELMALARPEALFMHCLPAHRNQEVTDEILDGPHSVVWDEAENRLHVQKGILLWCLNEQDLS